jgi:S1-C subfamily serine protease
MDNRSSQTLSPSAAAVGLSVALIVLFVLCALAELVAPGLRVAHAWVGLFTTAPVQSLQAWIEGLVFSVVFGAIAGAVFALGYSATIRRTG